MATYWDTQGIPFRPAVKVKLLSRWFDHSFQCWMIECRVTSRFTGECGTVRTVRKSALYAYQGVRRGMCGKLYWEGGMTQDDFQALPVKES